MTEPVRNSFISFIRCFIDEAGGHVLFIPHDTDEHHYYMQSDHFIMQLIHERLGLHCQTGMAPKDMNTQETKYLISKCDYFMGAKTHSTIASLSSLVPTISIAYSTKAYGINRDLFGHTDYVLPHRNLNNETLWQIWQRLVKDCVMIRETLAKKMPEVQQRAMAGALYLSELLSTG